MVNSPTPGVASSSGDAGGFPLPGVGPAPAASSAPPPTASATVTPSDPTSNGTLTTVPTTAMSANPTSGNVPIWDFENLGMAALFVAVVIVVLGAIQFFSARRRRREARRRQQRESASLRLQQQPLQPPGEPLPKQVRENLDHKNFKFDELLPSEDRLCPICLMEYEQEEQLLLLPCKHAFHTHCLDLWFLAHSTCPFCRLALVPDATAVDVSVGVVAASEEASSSTVPRERGAVPLLSSVEAAGESGAADISTLASSEGIEVEGPSSVSASSSSCTGVHPHLPPLPSPHPPPLSCHELPCPPAPSCEVVVPVTSPEPLPLPLQGLHHAGLPTSVHPQQPTLPVE